MALACNADRLLRGVPQPRGHEGRSIRPASNVSVRLAPGLDRMPAGGSF